jgi:hypothetical protein
LAETPTRLKALDEPLQKALINWGYAVCDAAMRKYIDSAITNRATFHLGKDLKKTNFMIIFRENKDKQHLFY